jgi:CBS-domain-containing membrane protein
VADNATLSREYLKSHGLKASDIMTASVATVNEDTPLGAVADLLESKRVKRVPVLREGKLVGVVSRADLLRAYVKSLAPAAAQTAIQDDGKLRGEIMRQLAREPWSPLASVNVVVHDGVAEIYGIAEREDQAKAIAVLAASVPGVKQVQNHVIISAVPHYAI